MAADLTAVKPAGIPWRFKMEDAMGDTEWRTLLALMDGILAPIQRESKAPRRRKLNVSYISEDDYENFVSHIRENTIVLDTNSTEDLDRYLGQKATAEKEFQQLLKGMLLQVPPETRNLLATVLKVLSYRATAVFLTGSPTLITQMTISQREELLHRWRTSYIPVIRGLFRQVTTLAKVVFTASNEHFLRLSGFPATPVGWKPPPTYPFEFVQFPPPPAGLSSKKSPPPHEVIETDVVIVGSGCGAGVCAKNIAEAGQRVLVLDKGYHFDAASLPMRGPEHFAHMLDGAGAITSDDNSILVVAGSCFGGGGTVNWSASLQTQGFVRKEWAGDRGLRLFETQEFQNCLDRVCGQMGVHDDFTPNHGNQVLLDGARQMGWLAKKVPQNTGRGEHFDGHCCQGCATGEKMGPVNGWFPDAARAGAKFVEGFKAEKILFDHKKGQRKATGVIGTWTSRGRDGEVSGRDEDKIVRRVIVKAKTVIASCGTLWTPCLLKNSGLTNSHIGKNLHLHPVNVVTAFFKEDVRPWEGGILTAVVNTFENQDDKGHGAKLECLAMTPCYAMQFLNWDSARDFKLRLLKYRHMNSYISIVRDRDSGYVYPDASTGQPRVCYTPSAFDRKHVMSGNVAMAKILYLQGALEIHVSLPGLRPFVRNEASSSSSPPPPGRRDGDDILSSVQDAGVQDPRFQAWLHEMERHGNPTPETPFTSAHQMGTCRMSTSERQGVVDQRGRVWGTRGLYVADASVFPSASGVNPMVTNMAISDWISRGIVQDMAAEGERARL